MLTPDGCGLQRYQNSQANYGQDEVVPLSELTSHLMARCEAQSHEVRSPLSCTNIVATTGASRSLAHTHILQTICTASGCVALPYC